MNACLYHAGCIDGLFSAFATFLGLENKNMDFIPVFLNRPENYDEICEKISKKDYEIIYFVDCIGPRDLCLKFCNKSKIIILDHHKTSKEYLDSLDIPHNIELNIDLNKSGAMIVFDYFKLEKKYPQLLQIFEWVQDYDLWKFIHPETKAFNEGIYESGLTRLIQKNTIECFEKMLDLNISEVLKIGNEKIKITREKVEKAMQNVKKITIEFGGQTFIGLGREIDSEFEGIVNDLANEMAIQSPFQPFGILFREIKSDFFKAYVRSKDFDSSKISLNFGGGGHASASGFTCTRIQMESFFK